MTISSYASFLTWRGLLRREPPRRPEPDRPAAPPSLRSSSWKYGLFGSRDEGRLRAPATCSRVSMESGAIDRMEMVRMADVPATIATFTVDRLAFSLSPPVVAVVIDFDGGGRFQCELTDVDPTTVKIGDRVEMTFRRLYTQDGIHNYFWKATAGPGNCRRAADMASHGIRDQVAIVGMGCTKFGEHWDKSTDDMLIESSSGGPRRAPASPSTTSTRSGWARWARVCRASRSADR